MPDICTNPLLKGRNKKVCIINQHNINPFIDKILVTMTPTAGFTVGFNLTFTGSVYIDFKDGGGKEPLTSGVEKTHLYSVASTYIAEITGNLTNITGFVADNCRITLIENFQSGTLTEFRIHNNLYNGTLDLSKTSFSTGSLLYFYGNSNLTGFIKPDTTSYITYFQGYNCNIIGEFDIDTISISGNSFMMYGNSNMTSIKHKTSGNGAILQYRIYGCNITGTHDMKDIRISSGGRFWIYSNPNLTGLILSAGNSAHLEFRAYSCDLTYTDLTLLDFAYNSQLTYIYNNSMTAAEVNQILYDIDSVSSSGNTGRVIDIGGTNAAPDSSSGGYDGLTAKTSLQSKGFTVITS